MMRHLVATLIVMLMASHPAWAAEAPEPSAQPGARQPASQLAAKPAHHCFPQFPKQMTRRRRTKTPQVAQQSTTKEGGR